MRQHASELSVAHTCTHISSFSYFIPETRIFTHRYCLISWSLVRSVHSSKKRTQPRLLIPHTHTHTVRFTCAPPPHGSHFGVRFCLLSFPICTAALLVAVFLHPNLWVLFGGMVTMKVCKCVCVCGLGNGITLAMGLPLYYDGYQ